MTSRLAPIYVVFAIVSSTTVVVAAEEWICELDGKLLGRPTDRCMEELDRGAAPLYRLEIRELGLDSSGDVFIHVLETEGSGELDIFCRFLLAHGRCSFVGNRSMAALEPEAEGLGVYFEMGRANMRAFLEPPYCKQGTCASSEVSTSGFLLTIEPAVDPR